MHEPIITDPIGSVNEFELGENGADSQVEVIAYYGPLQDAVKYANDNYPDERCMHSYDCCGYWYVHGRQVVRVNACMSLILISRSHNV